MYDGPFGEIIDRPATDLVGLCWHNLIMITRHG